MMDGQHGSTGTVGAHGQQLVKTTVAVHQVTTKEYDHALCTVGLALQFYFSSQKLKSFGRDMKIKPIGRQVDKLVESGCLTDEPRGH